MFANGGGPESCMELKSHAAALPVRAQGVTGSRGSAPHSIRHNLRDVHE